METLRRPDIYLNTNGSDFYGNNPMQYFVEIDAFQRKMEEESEKADVHVKRCRVAIIVMATSLTLNPIASAIMVTPILWELSKIIKHTKTADKLQEQVVTLMRDRFLELMFIKNNTSLNGTDNLN